MLIAQSTRKREERSYNKDSYLKEWIGKALLLLGWILIKMEPIAEILKKLQKTRIKIELESSLVKLKNKFRQTKKLLEEDWKGFNK